MIKVGVPLTIVLIGWVVLHRLLRSVRHISVLLLVESLLNLLLLLENNLLVVSYLPEVLYLVLFALISLLILTLSLLLLHVLRILKILLFLIISRFESF